MWKDGRLLGAPLDFIPSHVVCMSIANIATSLAIENGCLVFVCNQYFKIILRQAYTLNKHRKTNPNNRLSTFSFGHRSITDRQTNQRSGTIRGPSRYCLPGTFTFVLAVLILIGTLTYSLMPPAAGAHRRRCYHYLSHSPVNAQPCENNPNAITSCVLGPTSRGHSGRKGGHKPALLSRPRIPTPSLPPHYNRKRITKPQSTQNEVTQ